MGPGEGGAGGTILVSGGAAVLTGTDTVNPAPTMITHRHYSFDTYAESVYGIPVPGGWTAPFGAMLDLRTVSYNANGGGGNAPAPEEKAMSAKVDVAANPFIYVDHEFTGWNTKADGSGEDYAPGETFTVTGDTTLYAQWYAPVQSISLDKHNLTMAKGATYQLTATIVPDGTGASVEWTSSNEEIATVENGLVKAVESGQRNDHGRGRGKIGQLRGHGKPAHGRARRLNRRLLPRQNLRRKRKRKRKK